MKIRTVLATTVGVGIGYVLGARAGRDKFDEIKAQAQRIVSDPDVRAKVSDLPNQVKENLPKAKEAVSDALKGAAGKAESATGGDAHDDSSASDVSVTSNASDSHDSLGTPDAFDTPTTFTEPDTLGTIDPLDTPTNLGTFETPIDPETPSTFGTSTDPLDDPDAPTTYGSSDRS